MYSTCLFCSGALGRNESIEQFPVGRRLAFDAARGRLWVVCPRCARWNLTPLDARWEAIEEAERGYRDSKVRVATEHIGMAKLKDGLELVRIGKPLLPEYATWRYGDVFRRRKRRAIVFGAIGIAVPAGFTALLFGSMAGVIGVSAGTVSLSISAMNLLSMGSLLRSQFKSVIRIRVDETGQRVRLSVQDAAGSAIVFNRDSTDWVLRVSHKRHSIRGEPIRSRDGGFRNPAVINWTDIEGGDARRALSHLITSVNQEGANRRTVHHATELVADTADFKSYLAGQSKARGKDSVIHSGQLLGHMPAALRLALEMSLHQEDEQRAMEGELQALADRWREAEEVAAISDALLVPPELEERLDKLRVKP